MKILDVSKFQSTIDYAAVAKNIDGVILRAGFTGWGALQLSKDPFFEKHYAGFKAAGVPIGAYYYSAADTVAVAETEAKFCLSLLQGKQFELPIYFDVENSQRQDKLSKDALTAITDAFCSTVQAAGYFVGYYSYTAWLLAKLDTKKLSKYTLWKADYRNNFDTSVPCDMHQYTCKGIISGIAGGVDLSNCTRNFPAVIIPLGLNGFDKHSSQDDDSTIIKELQGELEASRAAHKAVQDRLNNLIAAIKSNCDKFGT